MYRHALNIRIDEKNLQSFDIHVFPLAFQQYQRINVYSVLNQIRFNEIKTLIHHIIFLD